MTDMESRAAAKDPFFERVKGRKDFKNAARTPCGRDWLAEET